MFDWVLNISLDSNPSRKYSFLRSSGLLVLSRTCFAKFCKIYRKTLVIVSLFSKAADLTFSFTEKALYCRYFLMNFAKIFRSTFHRTPKDDSFSLFNDLHLIHCPWNDDITIFAKSSILNGFRIRFCITQNKTQLNRRSP